MRRFLVLGFLSGVFLLNAGEISNLPSECKNGKSVFADKIGTEDILKAVDVIKCDSNISVVREFDVDGKIKKEGVYKNDKLIRRSK